MRLSNKLLAVPAPSKLAEPSLFFFVETVCVCSQKAVLGMLSALPLRGCTEQGFLLDFISWQIAEGIKDLVSLLKACQGQLLHRCMLTDACCPCCCCKLAYRRELDLVHRAGSFQIVL